MRFVGLGLVFSCFVLLSPGVAVAAEIKLVVDRSVKSIEDYASGKLLEPKSIDGNHHYEIDLPSNNVYRVCDFSGFQSRIVRLTWEPPEDFINAAESYSLILRLVRDDRVAPETVPTFKVAMPASFEEVRDGLLVKLDQAGGDVPKALGNFVVASFLHLYFKDVLYEQSRFTKYSARVAANSLYAAESLAGSYWGVSYAPIQPGENYLALISEGVHSTVVEELSVRNLSFFSAILSIAGQTRVPEKCDINNIYVSEALLCYDELGDKDRRILQSRGVNRSSVEGLRLECE